MFTRQPEYPSLAMDEVAAVLRGTDHRHLEPIDFGKGVSSFNPFDHVQVDLSRAHLQAHVGYGDINGLNSLRRAIARYYQETLDYDLSPERVCITDGASGALTIAMAMLLEAGDELVLPESCYPAYRVLARIFNARVRLAPVTEAGRIDVERLPARLSRHSRALLINSPGNPHGTYSDADALDALAGLGVPAVFDEVYQPLPLGKEIIPSAIHHTDRHMIVGSLSKSLSIPGFRIGYLIVPKERTQLMTNVKAVLNMCTSLPSQILAEKLLRHWDELVGRHQQMLQGNWITFEQTAAHFGLRLRSHPQAGFFALVDVSEANLNGMQVSHELARFHALGSTPGVDFQNHDNSFLRLNFACHPHQIKLGLARLANYLQCDERLPLLRGIPPAEKQVEQKRKFYLS
ncbi:MAG: pyridoxal phosphate-dependent aminotransferase [Thiohalocapsa sp. PB-PSB1]|jgi:aspartate/methionine/tyrosine aminotransferase|nr:MAG: hypothetical protein N838_28450 [Thiohalocapsa sp. PB-PSB1]QQO54098.1 MAG: pyridoxal phosphate-dependent aminotransferase [Thiohalocapsa sp. PB-PSB1]HCS91866.1 pyridoxal phosphate-dependent aminotransferase [Chromatiaceae bacterium]